MNFEKNDKKYQNVGNTFWIDRNSEELFIYLLFITTKKCEYKKC